MACLKKTKVSKKTVNGEYYIAPLYNSMISNDKKIFYHLIQKEDVIFTGTPSEYIELINLNYKNLLV